MKQDWKPGTMIYPLPAVLVSCGKCEPANLMSHNLNNETSAVRCCG